MPSEKFLEITKARIGFSKIKTKRKKVAAPISIVEKGSFFLNFQISAIASGKKKIILIPKIMLQRPLFLLWLIPLLYFTPNDFNN